MKRASSLLRPGTLVTRCGKHPVHLWTSLDHPLRAASYLSSGLVIDCSEQFDRARMLLVLDSTTQRVGWVFADAVERLWEDP